MIVRFGIDEHFEIIRSEVLGGPEILTIIKTTKMPIHIGPWDADQIAFILNEERRNSYRLDFGMTPMPLPDNRRVTEEDVWETIKEFNERFAAQAAGESNQQTSAADQGPMPSHSTRPASSSE